MKHFFLLISVLASFTANAQWSTEPTVNIMLSDTVGRAFSPCAVSNGNGGAFIVWSSSSIYGQKINANGEIQWDKYGNNIGIVFKGGTINPVAIPDDSGGMIIVAMASDQSKIGAARVRSDGTAVWQRTVCDYAGFRANPVLTTDSAGGAIITWEDARNGAANSDIYAQRVSKAGDLMWDLNGIPVCASTGNQTGPSIASDSRGGAFITWSDLRKTTSAIFAQRINSFGLRQWKLNGMTVCSTGQPAGGPKIVASAPGEGIITWTNGSASGTWDIFGQKVDLDTVQWAANGVSICNAALSQTKPAIVADGLGGAIVAWEDTRISFSDPNIYAQSVSSGGLGQWALNGIPICVSPDIQKKIVMASDGTGGVIIAWEDNRSVTYYDIYAQRVSHGGGAMWASNGCAVCTAARDQMSIGVTGDGKGGAILAWADYRNNAHWTVYAQGVQADGTLGITTSLEAKPEAGAFRLDQNYPNPFNQKTAIQFSLSNKQPVQLKIYDIIGNEIASLVNEEKPAGKYTINFDASNFPNGIYIAKLMAGNAIDMKKIILKR